MRSLMIDVIKFKSSDFCVTSEIMPGGAPAIRKQRMADKLFGRSFEYSHTLIWSCLSYVIVQMLICLEMICDLSNMYHKV